MGRGLASGEKKKKKCFDIGLVPGRSMHPSLIFHPTTSASPSPPMTPPLSSTVLDVSFAHVTIRLGQQDGSYLFVFATNDGRAGCRTMEEQEARQKVTFLLMCQATNRSPITLQSTIALHFLRRPPGVLRPCWLRFCTTCCDCFFFCFFASNSTPFRIFHTHLPN